MADRPLLKLEFFKDGCPDCGQRSAVLPQMPVLVPDDFDWSVRDYEGFRRFMLEELAASDPERQRWTEADIELVLVEVLAAGLDRASHALDATFGERFIETARLPQSLVALLGMIDGVDSACEAVVQRLTVEEQAQYGFTSSSTSTTTASSDKLMAALIGRPSLMDDARAAGLSDVGSIQSFVTPGDLADFLAQCPAIVQSRARFVIDAGTPVFQAHVLLSQTDLQLFDLVSRFDDGGKAFTAFVQRAARRSVPPSQAAGAGVVFDETVIQFSSIRTVLSRLVSPLLPIGARLQLIDGRRAGVFLRLCVVVAANYFRSEVEMAVREVLGNGPGGFFNPRNFSFGEAMVLSDLEEALMALDGIEGVIINHVQIVGRPSSEASGTGVLQPRLDEALTLDPRAPGPETGFVVLQMRGGQAG